MSINEKFEWEIINTIRNKLNDNFKPVIALNEQRFNVWKILDAHKDKENLLVTFNSLEGNKKYACIPLEKLLELLYRQ